MSYLWYLGGCVVLALIYDRAWWAESKPKRLPPPAYTPPKPKIIGSFKSDRFQHRGGHHNRYYPTPGWIPFWSRRD